MIRGYVNFSPLLVLRCGIDEKALKLGYGKVVMDLPSLSETAWPCRHLLITTAGQVGESKVVHRAINKWSGLSGIDHVISVG